VFQGIIVNLHRNLRVDTLKKTLKVCVAYVRPRVPVSCVAYVLGYGGSGKVQDHHNGVLPRCNGLHTHVWRHQWRFFQRRSGLVRIHL